MEPLLGVPAGWLPRESAELDAYMREMLAGGRIAVTDTSRALARARAVPAAVAPGLAGVPGDAAAHDRVAAAIDPPGLRVRVAPARRARARALDDGPSNLAAAASGARTGVAGGAAPGWRAANVGNDGRTTIPHVRSAELQFRARAPRITPRVMPAPRRGSKEARYERRESTSNDHPPKLPTDNARATDAPLKRRAANVGSRSGMVSPARVQRSYGRPAADRTCSRQLGEDVAGPKSPAGPASRSAQGCVPSAGDHVARGVRVVDSGLGAWTSGRAVDVARRPAVAAPGRSGRDRRRERARIRAAVLLHAERGPGSQARPGSRPGLHGVHGVRPRSDVPLGTNARQITASRPASHGSARSC